MTSSPAPHFRNFALLVLVLLLAVLAGLQLVRTPQIESSAIPVIVLEPARYPFTFVGFGDTRFTNPAVKLNSNAAARRAVVDRMADEKPRFLVLNDDLVFNGDNAGDWAVYDRETEKFGCWPKGLSRVREPRPGRRRVRRLCQLLPSLPSCVKELWLAEGPV